MTCSIASRTSLLFSSLHSSLLFSPATFVSPVSSTFFLPSPSLRYLKPLVFGSAYLALRRVACFSSPWPISTFCFTLASLSPCSCSVCSYYPLLPSSSCLFPLLPFSLRALPFSFSMAPSTSNNYSNSLLFPVLPAEAMSLSSSFSNPLDLLNSPLGQSADIIEYLLLSLPLFFGEYVCHVCAYC